MWIGFSFQAAGADDEVAKSALFARMESCQESELPRGHRTLTTILTEPLPAAAGSAASAATSSAGAAAATSSAGAAGAESAGDSKETKLVPLESKSADSAAAASRVTEDTFLVFEQLGGGGARKLAISAAKRGEKMLPW